MQDNGKPTGSFAEHFFREAAGKISGCPLVLGKYYPISKDTRITLSDVDSIVSYLDKIEMETQEIKDFIGLNPNLEDVKSFIKKIIGAQKGYQVSTTVELFIAGALITKASDIHLETEEESVRLRFRIDGMLTDMISFKKSKVAVALLRNLLLWFATAWIWVARRC